MSSERSRAASIFWGCALVTCLAIGALLALIDLDVVPELFGWHVHAHHPGLAAGVGFLLLTLLAGPIVVNCPSRLVLMTPLFPVIALIQTAVAVAMFNNWIIESTESDQYSPPDWVRWSIVVVLSVGGLLIVAKMTLLTRYSGIARIDKTRRAPQPLLGFQKRALEALAQRIDCAEVSTQGQIIQVAGRWGDGKSVMLANLQSYLDALAASKRDDGHRSFAVAITDVWKYESEPDLHLAVYERLLAHPRSLTRLSWLHIPSGLLVMNAVRVAQRDFRANVGAKGASVQVHLQLPRLIWHRAFERTVARLWSRGTVTVIVLDEIDRASAQVAQQGITMCRRSFDRPGVVIVIAYVRELIGYKVFNPLLPALPDLASTMEAVLAKELLRADAGLSPDPLNRPETLAGTPSMAALLRRLYSSVDPNGRTRIQYHFEEKYLGRDAARMPAMTGSDVAELVARTRHRQQLTRIAPGMTFDGRFDQQLATLVDEWCASEGRRREGNPMPPVRALDAELDRVLQDRAPVRTVPREDAVVNIIATLIGAVAVASARSGGRP